MAEFDAELYLRVAGERTLLDAAGDDGPGGVSPVDVAGHVLVAVGAITAGQAQAIVDDYQLRYLVLRSDSTALHVSMRASPATPGPAPRSLSLGFASATSRIRRVRPGPGPGARVSGSGLPQQLSLTDDRGTTVSGGLSGSGNDSEWDGEFEANPGLAQDTAWIEVAGERVDLPAEPAPSPDVRVEPLTAQDPAVAYLWAKVTIGTEFHGPDTLELSIETLVAVGALASDDPAIAEVRAVAAQLSRGTGGTRAAGRHGPLPEPWRSALHAALYGRVVATLRAWTGRPDLPVTLTMVPEAAPPALARDGDGMAAELPFGWISDVWARGLGTCWDRFCLAAEPAGDGWTLSAVAPDLGPPSHVTISGPPPG